MRLRLFALAFGIVATLSGCAKQPDARAEFDRQVREEIPKFKRFDAVEFFESGGHYWNVGAEGEAQVDEQCVLPLVKRLRDEASVQSEVLVSGKDEGFALRLLVSVPSDSTMQSRMDDLIAQADENFPGAILKQRGNDWLELQFLDSEELELIKQKFPDAVKQGPFSQTATPQRSR